MATRLVGIANLSPKLSEAGSLQLQLRTSVPSRLEIHFRCPLHPKMNRDACHIGGASMRDIFRVPN